MWVLAAMVVPLGVAIGFVVSGFFLGSEEDQWASILVRLRSPDLAVRREAADSLGDVAYRWSWSRRRPDRERVLRTNIEDLSRRIVDKAEDPEVRAALVHALGIGEYGPLAEPAIPALVAVALDETDHERVRSECVMILPYLAPHDRAGPAIVAVVADKNQAVRVTALQALSLVEVDREILAPMLLRAINDPGMAARMAAVSLAASMVKASGDNRGLLVLVRAAHDRDDQVRSAATKLSRFLGRDPRGSGAELGPLLESPDPLVRANAAAALTEIGVETTRCRAILDAMLHSGEAAVREAAVLVLEPSRARPTTRDEK